MKNQAALVAFGQHLRRLREQRGWSQQALADVADVSKPTIYRLETARFAATLDVLVSLAQGLEITLPELVSFAPPLLSTPNGSRPAAQRSNKSVTKENK